MIKLIKSFLTVFLSILKNEFGVLGYDKVTATTHDQIFAEITEGVFTDQSFVERLISKRETESGGNKFLAPLYTKNSSGTTGGFYSARDALSLDEYDGISASEHVIKLLQETLVLYKFDLAKNTGEAQALKLIDKAVNQSKRAIMERITKGSLSSGTAADGEFTTNQYTGALAIIAASGTYGTIAPAEKLAA